jgi:CHASE3 domain sensor protein
VTTSVVFRDIDRCKTGRIERSPVAAENGSRRCHMKTTLRALMSRSALVGAAPVVIALMLSGIISFSYNRLLKVYRDDVDHTFQVMSAIDSALLQLQDAETGQRGFIITGDESYLAPFQAGRSKLFEVLSRLNQLASDNADQRKRIERMRWLAEGKLSELEDTIVTRQREGLEPARLKVIGSAGKETMDHIRSVATEMRAEETSLFDARLASARFAERMMIFVAVVCVALSLGGRFAAFLLTSRAEKSAGSG